MKTGSVYNSALGLLAKPLVRFCIRHSIHIPDLIEACKRTFIEEATAELQKSGQKVNVSKLSVLSGLQRREVMRLADDSSTSENEPRGLISRVIGQWLYDKRFCSRPGSPRRLSFGSDDSEFARLVAAVSRDVHPGTVLSELERLKAVELGNRGALLKVKTHQEPGDIIEGLKMLSEDACDLYQAVDQNLSSSERPKNLHSTTEFDNIPAEKIPAIKKWILDEGARFQTRVRNYLSSFDRDLNKRTSRTNKTARVAVGVFSLAEEVKSNGRGEV